MAGAGGGARPQPLPRAQGEPLHMCGCLLRGCVGQQTARTRAQGEPLRMCRCAPRGCVGQQAARTEVMGRRLSVLLPSLLQQPPRQKLGLVSFQ